MVYVIIKRCPFCPSIHSQAEGIGRNLERNMGASVGIEDGAKDEFSVFVGGVQVIQRVFDDLPSSREVEAAVRNVAHDVQWCN